VLRLHRHRRGADGTRQALSPGGHRPASKFACVEMHRKATQQTAADFLRNLSVAVPYKIHTVLSNDGTHFAKPTGQGWTPGDITAMRAQKVRLCFRPCSTMALAKAALR
jgi:hypothetical protein